MCAMVVSLLGDMLMEKEDEEESVKNDDVDGAWWERYLVTTVEVLPVIDRQALGLGERQTEEGKRREEEEEEEEVFVRVESHLGVLASKLRDILVVARKRLLRYNVVDIDTDEYSKEKEEEAASRCICVFNGDAETYWNLRKQRALSALAKNDEEDDDDDDDDEDVIIGASKSIARARLFDELHLCDLALQIRPKAAASWSHRQWVLRQLRDSMLRHQSLDDTDDDNACNEHNNVCSSRELISVIRHEMCVVDAANMRRRRNLYAWQHRQRVIETFAPLLGNQRADALIENELGEMSIRMRSNVSDHSLHHYMRQLVLLRARHSSSLLPEMLVDQIEINASLIEIHPASESLWIHRRFLFDMSCCQGTMTTSAMTTDDELHFASRFYKGDTISGEALKYALWIAVKSRARADGCDKRDGCWAEETVVVARELVCRRPFHAKLYNHIGNLLAALHENG